MKRLLTNVAFFSLAKYQTHYTLTIATVTMVKARRKKNYFAIKVYSVTYKKLKQYA